MYNLKLLSLMFLCTAFTMFGMEKESGNTQEAIKKNLVGPFYVAESSHVECYLRGRYEWRGYPNPKDGKHYLYEVYLSKEATKDKTAAESQVVAEKTVDLLDCLDKRGMPSDLLMSQVDLAAKINVVINDENFLNEFVSTGKGS